MRALIILLALTAIANGRQLDCGTSVIDFEVNEDLVPPPPAECDWLTVTFLHGAEINGDVTISHESVATMWGGVVNGDVFAYLDGLWVMRETGIINGNLSSSLFMSGGRVNGDIFTRDFSRIIGGTFSGSLGYTWLNIYGRDFQIDGAPVSYGMQWLFEDSQLSGTLSNGDPIDNLIRGSGPDLWLNLAGDLTGDGVVDAADLNYLGLRWGNTRVGYGNGDVNFDDVVDAKDLNVLALSWVTQPQAEPVPEPSGGVWMILFALMAMLHRPKKQ